MAPPTNTTARVMVDREGKGRSCETPPPYFLCAIFVSPTPQGFKGIFFFQYSPPSSPSHTQIHATPWWISIYAPAPSPPTQFISQYQNINFAQYSLWFMIQNITNQHISTCAWSLCLDCYSWLAKWQMNTSGIMYTYTLKGLLRSSWCQKGIEAKVYTLTNISQTQRRNAHSQTTHNNSRAYKKTCLAMLDAGLSFLTPNRPK